MEAQTQEKEFIMARMIKLKSMEITPIEGVKSIKFDYYDLLMSIVKAQPQGGFTFGDIDNSLKITKKLDALKQAVIEDGTKLVLEDAEWDYLKVKLTAFRWAYPHDEIPIFRKAIENAESLPVAQPA